MELSGAVALVTGAGSGLGNAIARALSEHNTRVVAHYHQSQKEAQNLVDTAGQGRIMALQADLRSSERLKWLIDQTMHEFGCIDLLVNNAATLIRTPVDTLSSTAWDDIHAVNLRAPALLAVAAGQAMRTQGRGVIINIGDLAGIEPWPAYLAHATAKAGLHHLTRCLALALAPAVRVNAVVPGLVSPPPGWSEDRIERFRRRIPLARLPAVEEVVAAVLALIRNDAVTGQVLVVDGGQSLSF